MDKGIKATVCVCAHGLLYRDGPLPGEGSGCKNDETPGQSFTGTPVGLVAGNTCRLSVKGAWSLCETVSLACWKKCSYGYGGWGQQAGRLVAGQQG